MSTVVRPDAPVAHSGHSNLAPIDRSVLPTIKGYAEALKFVHNSLGIHAITARSIRTHTQRGTLKSFVISNRRHFAEADLLEWVLSLRRGGAQR